MQQLQADTPTSPPTPIEVPRAGVRRWLPDLAGTTWVVCAALAMLLPTLVQGSNIHDPAFNDQADQFMPWTMLAWSQVHHGHLPLWNPYNALGMPLAFNWMSAPFGLPALVGYLFPLHMAFAAQIVTTVIVGGTGVYVLARLMGLGALASAFAATAFELSGPFVGAVGWPIASVMSWAGWLIAAVILVLRGRHRLGATAMLAVVLAAAIYAGQPETFVQLFLALIIFVAVVAVVRIRRAGTPHGAGRPVIDLSIGVVGGLALAAPLLLPGIQLTRASINNVPSLTTLGRHALSLNDALYATRGSYLGVVALVMAFVGAISGWRRAEVRALTVIAIVMAGIAYVPPLTALMNGLPVLGNADWQRTTLPMAFAVAVLAGMGIEAVIRGLDSKMARAAAVCFIAIGSIVVLVLALHAGHLSASEAAVTGRSVALVATTAAVGAAVMGWIAWRRSSKTRRPSNTSRSWLSSTRAAAAVLLAAETAFLLTAGIPIWTTAQSSLSPNAFYLSVVDQVGGNLVGFGNSNCFPGSLGILQNGNAAYRLHEFAAFDPMTPVSYFTSWKRVSGTSAGDEKNWLFCPAIRSAAVARRFGVNMILEPPDGSGPKGSVYEGRVGGGPKLYLIPGSGSATVVPLGASGALPAPDAPGRVVPVNQSNPSVWRMTTNAASPSVLRLRLTDVPGWHASIDGHPLQLQQFSDIMLQARIPPGRHVIELRYWPTTFSAGIVVALLALAALVGAGFYALISSVRKRDA